MWARAACSIARLYVPSCFEIYVLVSKDTIDRLYPPYTPAVRRCLPSSLPLSGSPLPVIYASRQDMRDFFQAQPKYAWTEPIRIWQAAQASKLALAAPAARADMLALPPPAPAPAKALHQPPALSPSSPLKRPRRVPVLVAPKPQEDDGAGKIDGQSSPTAAVVECIEPVEWDEIDWALARRRPGCC